MAELIDKKEAIGAVCRNECGLYCGHDCDVITALRNLPTIEERKKGKWIYHDDDNFRFDSYHCSACRKGITVDAKRFDDIGFIIEDMKFCPNCGADMRGEKNENQNN